MKLWKYIIKSIVLISVSSFLCARTWYGKEAEHLAVFKDPVVDLYVNLPIQQSSPLSGAGYSDGICRRAHQGLCNEVVTIVDRKGQHVKMACDTVVYGFDPDYASLGKPLNTFWVHKKHLIFFNHLDDAYLYAFPGPREQTNNTLVLRFPWKQYSLGTRFVRALEHDTEDTYGALLVSSHPHKIKVLQIPKSHVRLEVPLTSEQRRAYFVQLAYDIIQFAQRDCADGIIPYVWGGSSFVHSYQDQNFSLQNKRWERPGKRNPYNGYDCSELVLRLAQVSDIPYLCKTTVVIEKLMRPLSKTDRLESGDLIRFPGHVMIVGNIARNELIEAAGYGGGFGKVQVMKLSQRFAGIQNYKQLRRAYHRKMRLKLLARDGSEQSEIKEFKLHKLL